MSVQKSKEYVTQGACFSLILKVSISAEY